MCKLKLLAKPFAYHRAGKNCINDPHICLTIEPRRQANQQVGQFQQPQSDSPTENCESDRK